MAAAVVTTDSRTPIADALSLDTIEALCNAQTRQEWGVREPHGQLWERVAERGWALDDLTTVERNQVWPWRHGDNRGPQIPAVAWPEVARHTSGIIRAGERIA